MEIVSECYRSYISYMEHRHRQTDSCYIYERQTRAEDLIGGVELRAQRDEQTEVETFRYLNNGRKTWLEY